MTVKELIDSDMFELINEGDDLEREISKLFCCDMLRIAMSKASAGCAWVTVMGNINTLAVAALSDSACVILAEGVRLDEPATAKAQMQGITVLRTEMPIFEAALSVHEKLS